MAQKREPLWMNDLRRMLLQFAITNISIDEALDDDALAIARLGFWRIQKIAVSGADLCTHRLRVAECRAEREQGGQTVNKEAKSVNEE